jgi:hypothetical protein
VINNDERIKHGHKAVKINKYKYKYIYIYIMMVEPSAVQGVKHGLLVRWILQDWLFGTEKY